MTKAIAVVLPDTRHRYCLWHIVNNFFVKISALSYTEHYEEFKKSIWNSESPEEFEARWVVVVEKANLSNNEWLDDMYKIREKWIPAYMKHIFSAHMTSSQRAKISHAFFKRFVSPHNSLLDFVTRLERALERIRHNELDLDHKDINEKPQLKTIWVMEETMSELYTRTIFHMFQDEIYQNNAYVVKITNEDEHHCVYNVERVKASGSRPRVVVVEKSSDNVSCSCKMFESDGIPCRHMLAYFRQKQFLDLPNQYILQRWTKSAKAMRVFDDLGGGVKEICDTSLLLRRNSLFQLASTVIDDAVLTEDGTQVVREGLKSIQNKLRVMKLGNEDGEGSVIQVQVSIPPQHGFKEPLQVRAKGCGKRLKGRKEKVAKMGNRKCNGCGLRNQLHDKRNCPKRLKKLASSEDGRLNNDDDDDDNDDYDD